MHKAFAVRIFIEILFIIAKNKKQAKCQKKHWLNVPEYYADIRRDVIYPQLTFYLMIKTECFHLRSGTRQGCLLSSLLFSIVSEVLDSTIMQEKESHTD